MVTAARPTLSSNISAARPESQIYLSSGNTQVTYLQGRGLTGNHGNG